MDSSTALFGAATMSLALVALILAILGVISATEEGIARFHARNEAKASTRGHNAHDPHCRWWRGAGDDILATCPSCSPLGRLS